MDMKHLIPLAWMAMLTWTGGCQSEPEPRPLQKWHTDMAAAQAESAETGKPILADFTGSDWCPPCMMLKKQVFHTAEFAQWARDNVVLMEVDFPKFKPQTPKLRAQNQQLQQQYQAYINGVPTVILMDAEGRAYGALVGYDRSSPADWIKQVEAIIQDGKALKPLPPQAETNPGSKSTTEVE